MSKSKRQQKPPTAPIPAPSNARPDVPIGPASPPVPKSVAQPATRRPVEHDILLSALPHPIVVVADDDCIIYANGAAESFFDVSIAMLKRRPLHEILHPGSPLVALVGQIRRSAATVNEYGIEIALQRQNSLRLVDVYGGLLPDQPNCVVLMLQQRSMAQMIERQITHRQAARSVSGMASVLAHEIKNPLSGIRGAAQLLEPTLSSDDRQLARLIVEETDRIRALVDRMEVFGDERPLEKSPVNIHAVLDHVKRLASTGFAAGVRIIEDYDPSLPAIPANRDKLVQAFLNLIKNAAEALESTGDTARIILRTAFRPGVRLTVPGSTTRVSLPFMIEIEDSGPGIRNDVREHLFDPFVTTKHSGTGLGLSLVAKIISDHGGIIECDSVPKRTIFRVLLPIDDKPTAKPPVKR
jgi:two-component system, NtrC family, nitrogen regulation sensor histidine kinase GlnL